MPPKHQPPPPAPPATATMTPAEAAAYKELLRVSSISNACRIKTFVDACLKERRQRSFKLSDLNAMVPKICWNPESSGGHVSYQHLLTGVRVGWANHGSDVDPGRNMSNAKLFDSHLFLLSCMLPPEQHTWLRC